MSQVLASHSPAMPNESAQAARSESAPVRSALAGGVAGPGVTAPGVAVPDVAAPDVAAPGEIRIEPMWDVHGPEVLAIYQAGIDDGNATFETSAPSWPEFSATRLAEHRFVALSGEMVVGWVAVSTYSSRCVYAGVVEHSVYVHPAARGQGVGRRLLDALIASTEAAGIWTIQSGIFPENTASIALHTAAGFRVVGTRERIARQHGRWRDILLMERRSPVL